MEDSVPVRGHAGTARDGRQEPVQDGPRLWNGMLQVAAAAALSDDRFAVNVRALTEAVPEPLRMDEMEACLGAVWIDGAA